MHIQRSDGIGEVLMIGDHTMKGFLKTQCIASSLFDFPLDFYVGCQSCFACRCLVSPRRLSPYRSLIGSPVGTSAVT
jgi:hypothetical protein